jgi:hypothetical protein
VDVTGVEVVAGGGVLNAQYFHQRVQGEAVVEADGLANLENTPQGWISTTTPSSAQV